MDFGLHYLKASRERLDFNMPELWFMLAAVFVTINWIARSFIGLPDNLQLNFLMEILSNVFIFIMYGLLVYLAALLSLYLDENMRLSEDSVISSNFNFTRLFTPIARALLLLFALLLIISDYPTVDIFLTLIGGVAIP
jgi:hypothetical protein